MIGEQSKITEIIQSGLVAFVQVKHISVGLPDDYSLRMVIPEIRHWQEDQIIEMFFS